jgi:hypothetical protein
MDRKRLIAKEYACRLLNVPYKFGGKAAPSASPSDLIKGIDCSGYVAWLMYDASDLKVRMPSGSVQQRSWCRKMGFKNYGKLGYLANCLKKDNRLRIAFFAGSPGHVWLIFNGQTIESYGGHGPGRRSAISAPLMRVQECFVLTDPLE